MMIFCILKDCAKNLFLKLVFKIGAERERKEREIEIQTSNNLM